MFKDYDKSCRCRLVKGEIYYCRPRHAHLDTLNALEGKKPSLFRNKSLGSKATSSKTPSCPPMPSPTLWKDKPLPRAPSPHPPSQTSIASSRSRDTPDLSDAHLSIHSTSSVASSSVAEESSDDESTDMWAESECYSPFPFDHPSARAKSALRQASNLFLTPRTPRLSTETALAAAHDDLRQDSIFNPYYVPLTPLTPAPLPEGRPSPLKPLLLARAATVASGNPALPQSLSRRRRQDGPPPLPSSAVYSPTTAAFPTSPTPSSPDSSSEPRFPQSGTFQIYVEEWQGEHDGVEKPADIKGSSEMPMFLQSDPYPTRARDVRRRTGQTVLDELEAFHEDALGDRYSIVSGSTQSEW